MAKSFFWYDLETSGTEPRWDRIVQFAGCRTSMIQRVGFCVGTASGPMPAFSNNGTALNNDTPNQRVR